MLPIAHDDALRVGDVVHHPAFGFATLADIDEKGAKLRWEHAAKSSPTFVSRHGLTTSYRRCRPGGLLARRALEPPRVRRLAQEDPVAVLGLLLADLGEAQPLEHAQDWMRQVVGDQGMEGNGFDGWWNAILALAGVDERFNLGSDRIALASGVDAAAFAVSAPPTPLTTPEPAVTALNEPPRAAHDVADLWSAMVDMAGALARLHARGATALRRHDAARREAGGWTLPVDPVDGAPRDDVAWACQRVVEELVGLPLPEALPAHELVDALAGAVPSVAPELLGVMRMALARDPALRPRNGVELSARLAVARAVWQERAALPTSPRALVCAGFDTHIGTLKSLVGQANQDAFLLLGEPDLAFFAVADGISTSTAGSGDLASSLAIRTLRLQWTAHQDTLRAAEEADVFRFLTNALDRANRVICEAATRLAHGDLNRHVPMGTTIVVGLCAGDRVFLAALGDSRALLCGQHGVAPLTWDQNLNAMRLRQATLGHHAGWDEHGYALVGYLGHFDEMGAPSLPPPIFVTTRLLPGEWLVVASDGLTDHAAAEEAAVYRIVQSILSRHGTRSDPHAAMAVARRLVLAANEGTGGDNVTVLALTLSADAAGPGAESPVPSGDED